MGTGMKVFGLRTSDDVGEVERRARWRPLRTSELENLQVE